MKKIILASVLVASFTCNAQLGGLTNKTKGGKNSKIELYEEEKIDLPQRLNNIGKVVFSNEDIERDLPESKYITTYTWGDKLFIRAWLANSPSNSMMLQLADSGIKPKEINANRNSFDGGMTKVIYLLYLDGKQVASTSYADDFDDKAMASIPSVRADLNDGTETNNFGEMMYRELKRKQDLLTPGTHKLRMELLPIKTFAFGSDFKYTPIAVGEIDMIVKDMPIDINDSEACLPKSGMTDKALESKIIAAYKAKFPTGDAPKEVRITSTRWNIIKHEYTGVPLRRTINATIGKTGKDGKCNRDEYSFTQDYDGTKYQDELYLYGEGIGTQREISCKCFAAAPVKAASKAPTKAPARKKK
jgi:hypothetical protein